MASTTTNETTQGLALPTLPAAHWLVRLPLAAVFLYHGITKFPALAAGAEFMGLPLAIWTLVAIGEVLAGAALIGGGLLRTNLGDVVTRLGGIGVAIIMVGAIYLVHLGPWSGMEFQVLLLGAGLYFAARGNAA
ncbi:DoxX family membrane protein [Rhodobacterales bacterium HKCCE3408]|nr:DoxX family membrane protein [Rhodobacterales bacterium HKCCE3408]